MKDIDTDEIIEFDSCNDLADELDFCPSMLTVRFSNESQPFVKNKYLLKMKTDTDPWREISDRYSELDKALGNCVVVRYNDKDVTIYESAVECARNNNLLKTTLNWRLNNPKNNIHTDGYRYRRYSDYKQSA